MARDDDDEEDLDDEEEEEEFELVLFQGSFNGVEPNLRKNTRLVEAGLHPAKRLISDAISRRAETIVIDPKGGGAKVRLEVDGISYPGASLRKQNALAITQVLKLLSGLEPKEKKRPQKGGVNAEFDGKKYEISIATEPVAGGAERLTIRSRSNDGSLDKPDQIGFSEELKEKISEIAGGGSGMMLACGPPSTGVSTTCESGVLRSVDAYIYSIVTIANMGGREILNVTPFEKEEEDEELNSTLLRIIRADNHVVLSDPIKDGETFQTLAQRADEIVIVAEFRARDTAAGIAQLVEWGGADLVTERVRGVITQRLIRRLCDKCKFAYRPHPKMLAKIGLPKETRVLYKPRPELDEEEDEDDLCSKCGGLNYFGRVGMFELIELTDKVKEAIHAGGDPAEIRKAAKADEQVSLQQDGLRLVKEGITSLEELQRIFRPPAKKGAKKKKKRRRPS